MAGVEPKPVEPLARRLRRDDDGSIPAGEEEAYLLRAAGGLEHIDSLDQGDRFAQVSGSRSTASMLTRGAVDTTVASTRS